MIIFILSECNELVRILLLSSLQITEVFCFQLLNIQNYIHFSDKASQETSYNSL